MNVNLKPGDIFCTKNPMWLGRVINFIQKINSKDDQSEYGHAGIIVSCDGDTFESVWTIRKQNLYEKYTGRKVLIGRHCNMTNERFLDGYESVLKFEGNWYPYWRLLFHLIPLMSKYVNTGRFKVCSELTDHFAYHAGVIQKYRGRNPDDIADMIHRWKGWDVIFEDIL